MRRRTHPGKQRGGKPADRTPYLEIHTANTYRRFRRDVVPEETMDEVLPGCCQLKAFVDFEEFGWHTWILSPKGFNQTFCIGGCAASPVPDAGVTGTPPVCCHPVEVSPLPVIYLDTKGDIKRAEIPDLVTHRCGCP
ncbi:hypothetical protein CAPTEDRAFT_123463 [Capitella teleta]|uniref:TGF-beta family profile domain-containing protein n=1 Tax=Capitella teleta TaxID=283909 RepID=R7V0X5_CAPTE|nr:hypothetical protein CAPTEDRAFT_123463 [Capitella teleta]|eukprot:ELU12147.1 hypothetical protein CAPTEDRAFT_123463 [Capitella teleta]